VRRAILVAWLLSTIAWQTASQAAFALSGSEKRDRYLFHAETAGEKHAGTAEEVPVPFFGQLCPLEERLFDDAADGRLDLFSPLDAALIASGIGDAKTLRCYEVRLAVLIAELDASGNVAGGPRERARAVFEFMHCRVLVGGYRIECTDLRTALDDGRFNCVSASVLFNCMAGEFGLEVCGLEIPGHMMSRVTLPKGSLDVETTCPGWFRLMGDPDRQAAAVKKTIGEISSNARSQTREVSPVEIAAMIYYNRGVDLLAEKRFAEAANANAKALRLDCNSTTARGNLLATLNNWAIELGGSDRHAEAVDLLRQGLSFDPDYEAFSLNYVHVHHQWVEHLCRTGRFEEALNVLAAAAGELPNRPYFRHAPQEVHRRWDRAVGGG